MERSEHGNRSETNTDYPFPLLCFLKLHTYTRVQVSIDICELIIPLENEDLKWSIIYRVLGITHAFVHPFPSAGRWEREVWDMFGVSSINHPDLRRISTYHGFEGHPLRKDLPPSGYVEVRYDDPRNVWFRTH
ncbi:hypothetical protein MKW92_048670 [Papaver armeniacum]|nr:hypothetical protein MKW92_048670 [Papaver armeniacum]